MEIVIVLIESKIRIFVFNKRNTMKALLYTAIFGTLMVLSSATSWAQDFNGVITVKEVHRANVVKQKMYIKGDKVRIETYLPNDENALKGVKLIDLASGKVTALIPARKLYLDMPSRENNRPLSVNVDKSNEKKAVLGKDCQKVTVSSAQKRSKIEYWINSGNFSFYGKMLSVLNKNENTMLFFEKIEGLSTGAMPLKMVEMRMDDTVISTWEVTKIQEEDVDDSMFVVPDDYSLEER